jgi:predicted SAM-dependent methyltransferase
MEIHEIWKPIEKVFGLLDIIRGWDCQLLFARKIIDNITRIAARRNRSRLLDPAKLGQEPFRLNLGCGLAVAKGWINIDASFNALIASWPGAAHDFFYRFTGSNRYYTNDEYRKLLSNNTFVCHDLLHGIPFMDQSIEYAYSSHFLEHLTRTDAVALLQEVYRVLKPGGMLRIAIPDLEFAISLYVRQERERMLRNYFFVEDKANPFSQHRYMYDFQLLQSALEEEGFVNIARCSYQEGKTPDLSLLDNRPEDSLFVEASRPD